VKKTEKKTNCGSGKCAADKDCDNHTEYNKVEKKPQNKIG